MSYEPTIWKKGDKVTSTKLNKIENGIQGNDEEITSIKENLTDKAPVITETASGSIASFTDGADDLPLKSLVVNINPVQDLHGQESPYPAGGGKNKFNGTFLQGYWAYADGTWVNSPNWITTEKIPCKASTSYTVSADAKVTRWQGFVWYDSNGDFISTDNLNSNANIGLTKTSPSNAAYLIFNIAGYPSSSDTIAPSDVTYFQLEEGSSSTAYAPYSNICPISGWTEVNVNHSDADMTNPTTITIDLGQTVYGGKLDVLTGVLTVDRAMVDLGAKNWYPSTAAGRTRFRTSITDIERISSPNVRASLLCSNYPTKTANQTYQGTTGVSLQQNEADIYIYDPQTESMTTAEFKSAMSGVQLCYKLATPQTYQLTPTEVATLLGDNTIWADTGDTEVEYRTDPDLYIQRKMPEVPVDDVQINGTSIVSDGVANVPVDTSLTIAGAAADAKKTGDEIGDLKEGLKNTSNGTISTNLIGNDYTQYYPVNIPAGTFYLNIATSDGSNFAHSQFPSTTLKLGLYDSSKTLIGSAITLGGSISYRDVRRVESVPIAFLKLNIPSDVPLMVSVHDSVVGHAVAYQKYFYNAKQLSEMVEQFVPTIPDYYQVYMDSKIAAINSLDNVDIQVAFFTDAHYPSNAQNSPQLIRYLWGKTPLNFVVNGGDVLTQAESKKEAIQFITRFNNLFDFAGINYFPIIGNHEHNNSNGSSTATQLSLKQVQLACYSKKRQVVFSDFTAYYFDDDLTKCRYYFVGTKQSSQLFDEDVGWIIHSFLTIPDGYSVVIYSHAGLKYDENYNITGVQVKVSSLCNALLALANKVRSYHSTMGASEYLDFSSLNATPIAIFAGHVHFDGYYQYSVSAYNGYIYVIATTCDAYGNQPKGSSATRTPKTVNEQAFDVISINKTDRLITTTRIGAGSDRTFTYSDYHPVS